MRLLDDLLYRPLERPVRVAFADADDWRVVDAAAILQRRGVIPLIESRRHTGGARRLVGSDDADVLLLSGPVREDVGAFALCLIDTLPGELVVCIHGGGVAGAVGRVRSFLRELSGRDVRLRALGTPGTPYASGADACVIGWSRDDGSTSPCQLMREFGQAQTYGPFYPDMRPVTAVIDPQASVEEIVGTATLLSRIALSHVAAGDAAGAFA